MPSFLNSEAPIAGDFKSTGGGIATISSRHHDLDALRAIVMLLGIVLHASYAFTAGTWAVQDVRQNDAFSLINIAIHGFRMPLFFVMSGFFTAMLWRKRGLRALVQHRFRRVFLPLLLGVFTIIPLTRFVWDFAAASATDISAKAGIVAFINDFSFTHLWFLWQLCLLVAGFAIIAWLIDHFSFPRLPNWLVLSPVRYLWLVPLTMIPQAFMKDASMAEFGPDTSIGLFPAPSILAFYCIFFCFGALYYDYDDPEGRISRGWKMALPLGLFVLFPLGVAIIYFIEDYPLLGNFVQAAFAWVMVFGLMGLFHKFFSGENKTMRYVSDSSYWVYLAHLPLIIMAQYVISEWPIPAVVKFTLICVVVTGFLLYTYHFLVRYTWMGTFLNGSRKRPEEEPAQSLAQGAA